MKLLRNNSVYCLQKTGSRVHNNETKAKDPDFNWSKFIKLLQSYWLELLGAVLVRFFLPFTLTTFLPFRTLTSYY